MFRGLLKEMGGKERYVVSALAKGWDADWDNAQAVIEVFAEIMPFHLPPEVLVGRADYAYVYGNGLLGANPLEAPLLEYTQELHLHVPGEL
jgi:hypothetical protein